VGTVRIGPAVRSPSDPAFQKRVILAALRLLERERGPVIIEDSADDDPRAEPDPAWRRPLFPSAAGEGSADSLAARLEAEIVQLQGAHRLWVAQHGRSTVGLSGLAIGECAEYVADWLRGNAPPSPREGFSAPLILRFAVDDVKAYCLEAAAAGAAKPSSRQLGDWFWNETVTGAAIHALREMLLASKDERLSLIVGNFMVPAARVRAA
jgi:hypothetical protein